MDLIERYLKAVGAQLPAAGREDILAELRDLLMSRVEAREAELGRPLTEAEVEAVLREVGHPPTVAARYGAGPQHVVGPELYPWWLFGVKTALTVLVLITAVGAVARILLGDVEVGMVTGCTKFFRICPNGSHPTDKRSFGVEGTEAGDYFFIQLFT